jgi:hypothetical protein
MIAPMFGTVSDVRRRTPLSTISVFCSNNLTQVFKYGEPYVILPCDRFDYTWYRNATDLWQENFNQRHC